MCSNAFLAALATAGLGSLEASSSLKTALRSPILSRALAAA